MTKRYGSQPAIPEELTDNTRGIRLQKAMAQAGVASRRDCEAMVEEGRVSVNGQLVRALPAWVDPARDRVELDGRPLARPRKTGKHRAGRFSYVMVNKPKRVISTTEDEAGRTSVVDLVDAPVAARLFPVGRLDAESTGLMLLTDDGELVNRLTHPSYEVAKEYRVSVEGRLTQEELQKLRDGLFLAHQRGRKAQPAAKRASVERVAIVGYEKDRAKGDRTTLAITLQEGQNREIRRLLARLGHKVRGLKRTSIGPVKLKGLAVGQWRLLTGREVAMLYKAAGLKAREGG